MAVIEETRSYRASPGSHRRIAALDAGRGYATGIIVFTPLFAAFDSLAHVPWFEALRVHLTTHSGWNGLHYVDLGFPYYLQAVGISIALSLGSRVEQPDKSELHRSIFKRTLILMAIGFLLNGGFREPWPAVRLVGILQRIAVCYCVGALFFLHSRLRTQVYVCAALLLGYWALLAAYSPSGGTDPYGPEDNLARYLDEWLLPGRKIFGTWDPEGLLSTLGALGSCLLGILTGQFLRLSRATPQQNVAYLLLGGAACLVAGLFWSEWLPLNKKLWTSSYVLVSAGNTLLTLAIFYQIADVWRRPNWLFPLAVVGLNPLVAFVAVRIIPFRELAQRLVGGDVQAALGIAGPVALGAAEGMLGWLLLYWLYRHGIALKA
jgi:predicted acyltransferase